MVSPEKFVVFNLLILGLFLATKTESALTVPFQDFATPGPTISKKVYYLQEQCSICEVFRPDFTKIQPPPEPKNETTEANTTATAVATTPVTTESKKTLEEKTDEKVSTLKRVARDAELKKQNEDPKITMLKYDRDVKTDSDEKANGTWTWREAFKKIKAKWIEQFSNDTSVKVENKMTAKLKVEKTDDGEEKRNFFIEFKKKIQNLTLLDVEDAIMKAENEKKKKAEEEETKKDEPKPPKNEKVEEKERVLVKRAIKQIVLDPVKQPSIVIRSKRSTKETMDVDSKGNETVVELPREELKKSDDKNSTKKFEKCRLLIRFKSSNQTGNETDADLATTVTIASLETTTPSSPVESDSKKKIAKVDDDDEKIPDVVKSFETPDELAKADNDEKIPDVVKSLETPAEPAKVEETVKPTEIPESKEKAETKKEKIEEPKVEIPEKESPKIESPKTKVEDNGALKKADKVEKSEEKVKLDSKEEKVNEDKKKEPLDDKPEHGKKSLDERSFEPNEGLKESKEKLEKDDEKKEKQSVASTEAAKVASLDDQPEKSSKTEEKETVKAEEPAKIKEPSKSEEPKEEKPKEKPEEKETVKAEESKEKVKETPKVTETPETVSEPEPEPLPKDSKIGFMINIRKFVNTVLDAAEEDLNRTQKKMEKNPFWKNIKIFTSEPDMTEFWYEGKKMTDPKSDKSTRAKRSIKTPLIDMIDMSDIVSLLSPNETDELNIADEKWILLERKIFFDDPDEDSDEELIINLFFKPKEPEHDEDEFDIPKEHSVEQLECPRGTFDCKSDGIFCIPNSLKCNGEDNCGNGHDEMSCPGGGLSLFYVYNGANHESFSGLLSVDHQTQDMFWFGTRILFILFATCLFLYILLLLCRMCDKLRSDPSPMFIIPKGNYISISGDTIERKSLFGKQPKGSIGSNMDTRGSKIREYIYVNNNYGQPQGSTVVNTDVQPPPYSSHRRNKRSYKRYDNVSPDITDNDEYPPLYDDFHRQYGTKK